MGPAALPASDLSVAILAGGYSRRLGRDKASLRLGGRTLLERSLELARCLSRDRLVVGRPGQPLAVESARRVDDLAPFVGVPAAIAAALRAARHEWCAIIACDLPFVQPALIHYLLTLRPGYEVVIPSLAVGLEPLCALYHRRCLPALRRALEHGERRAIAFHAGVRVRHVPAGELVPYDAARLSFININTPADLERARALSASMGPTGRG